ncbi:MAG: hypothetical protein BGO41_12625 [Clostridiales bacterium 38-18]|nr:MAG: hypothetical protein BGO41_12625 [Clostridiales bacterium 38-18]
MENNLKEEFNLKKNLNKNLNKNHIENQIKKVTNGFNLRIILYALILIKVVSAILLIDNKMMTTVASFVSHFSISENPWDFYLSEGNLSMFPYPSLMLYIFKVFFLPAELLRIENKWLLNGLYLLPILIADLSIYFNLNRLFPNKKGRLLFFYFASPVVFYASYILGQLDVIAVAFIIVALCELKEKRYLRLGIILALGFAVKLPVLFSLPLVLIYLFRTLQRDRYRRIAEMLIAFVLTSIMVNLPFLFSESFIKMVYFNPDQSLLYHLYLPVGSFKIYIAYLAILVIYARFLMYEKINRDLLHNFLAVVYTVFVLLVPPSESWYVWSFILCAVLFVSLLDKVKISYLLSLGFSLLYLLTFVGGSYIHNDNISNLIFTTLEGALFFIVYVLYKYGIKSNRVYKKKEHATLIGIGGDSGVGKTTVKHCIEALIGHENIVPIESDGDHKWERGDISWNTITHLNPKANYLYRQAQYLKALKNGSAIERVEYDHDTGAFTEPIKVYPNDFIIVAGLHPFFLPQTRKLVDLKIYIDTEESLRRHWKIKRDVASRGYSIDQIQKQIDARVEDAQKYITPQKNYADLIIRYYSEDDFEMGGCVDPSLKLELMMTLEVDVEPLLDHFTLNGIDVVHYYDADLKFQHIHFNREIESMLIAQFAENFIENIEEIVNGHKIRWENGYHGIIQLFTLVWLSHQFKKGEENEL